MAEGFENLDNILRDWAKDKGIKQVREARKRKIKLFLLKNDRNNFRGASVGSRAGLNHAQLLLVSREPFLYLEFSKPNKQNVSDINLFKKFNFSQCQNNCGHAD